MLSEVEERTQAVLVSSLFRILDRDGDGRLTPEEFLLFAFHANFKGDDLEWIHDFGRLCKHYGDDPGVGVHKDTFARIVTDAFDRGCRRRNWGRHYCSSDELRR